MARAIWSGSISFGLLNVPVKLYSAVARRGISLRELRESDGARIRHRRVAEGTDEEVPYEKIVKAFEITPDRYVPLTKEEMAALAPEKTRAIEVQDFVDLDQIDPIYFDSPYYLGPADGAEKAYSLLAKAMEETGKIAIARFVFRNKEHLAALRPNDGVLTLTTMRFADEVVPPGELDDVLPAKQPKVAKREVEMAEQLIDSLTREFDPSAYRDEYREELLALIERKAEGKDVARRRLHRGAEGDQGARPDGGARGEHRRGQGQGGRRGGEKSRETETQESRESRPEETFARQGEILEIDRAEGHPRRGRRA